MQENSTTGKGRSTSIPLPPYKELLGSLIEQIRLDELQVSKYERYLSLGLPPLVATEILALALGISPKLLYAMAQHPHHYYRTYAVSKRSGGKRRIAAPRVFLKTVQKWILRNLLYTRKLPPFVTGFVPGRGLLTNARVHVGRKYLVKLDIKDFFPSVKFDKVESVFKSFDYPEKVARLLTHLCTFRNSLPQGAPTSPCLANLVFLPCDTVLKTLSDNAGLIYTRYADDLTFSANEPIDAHVMNVITTTVNGFGFPINPAKSRNWRPGQRLITTGMVVNEKAHPPREFRRKLRAIFHLASRNPRKFKPDAQRLVGLAAFVNIYDQGRGHEYLEIARSLAEGSTRPQNPRKRIS